MRTYTQMRGFATMGVAVVFSLGAYFAQAQEAPNQPASLFPEQATKNPKTANTTQKAQTPTKLDPDAVKVIDNLKQLPDTSTDAVSNAVKKLADKTGYAAAVQKLVDSVSAVDTDVKTAQVNWSKSGKSGDHLLIHYMDLTNANIDPSNPSKVTSITDHWYIWQSGIGFAEYTGTRLYGVKNLYVLSIAGPSQNGGLITTLKAAQYYAVIKKKLPANWENLLGFLQIAGFAAQAKETIVLYGFGKLLDMSTPANVNIGAYLETADGTGYNPVGTNVAILNEGLHIWDAGVGVPVTQVKDLQYNQTSNGIQPAQVNKAAVFGLVNLYFHPLDLQNPGGSWHPSLAGGFALQGEVRDRLFAGISTNLPPIKGLSFTKSSWYQLFQPYAGVEFLSTQRPVTNPLPGGTELDLHTVRKLAIGLEIPVKTAVQRINSAKKATSKNSGGATQAVGQSQ
jgi:hypothetical protein